MHAVAILYSRRHQMDGDVTKTEQAMSHHVIKDMDFMEYSLGKSSGPYLLGDLTAADFNMHFSVEFILAWELGTQGKKWPNIEQYIKDCCATESYQRAVQRTGHKLYKV